MTKPLFFVGLALSLPILWQEGVRDSTAEEFFKRGMQYLSEGRWSQAGEHFKKAISVDPNYREAHEKYQEVEYSYFEKKKPVRAEYIDLLRHNPHNPLFHYLLARVTPPDQRDSLTMLKSALALDSSFVPEYQRVVPVLLYYGRIDEARSLIDAGLRHTQKHIHLLYLQDDLYLKEGKISERARVLQEIIHLYPDLGATSRAYYDLAQLTESDSLRMRLLEHAVRVDTSGMWPAYYALFDSYARTDKPKAIQFARKAMMIEPVYADRRLTSEMYDALYRLSIENNDTTGTIALAKEVSELTVRDPDLYASFGNRLVLLNRELSSAIRLLEKAITYNTPENAHGIRCFGPMSRSAIQRNCDRADAFHRSNLGWAFYRNGEYDKALSTLQSALGKTDQAEPVIYQRLGITYERLSRPQEAISSYVRSLSFEENSEARLALENLASRETKLNVIVPAKRVTDIDSAIVEAQLPRARRAPDFTLKNLSGVSVSSSSFRGKVLLIDFWATWCGPCVAELPKLQELFNKYEKEKKVSFLAISTDANPEDVKSFIEKKSYTLPVLIDKGIADAFGVRGIPALFVIDQKGLIRYTHVGYNPNIDLVKMLSKEIDIILAGTAREQMPIIPRR